MNTKFVLAGLLLTLALPANSQVLYQENFEGTTGTSLPLGWAVPGGKFGISADNPVAGGINTSNRVLAFTSPTQNFDTYSAPFDLSAYHGIGDQVTLSFDFLSTATINQAGVVIFSVADSGAFDTTGSVIGGSPAARDGGIGDDIFTFSGNSSWEHFSINLASVVNFYSPSDLQTSYIGFEQWNDGSVASNTPVYFDNLAVTAVPEPGMYGMIFGIFGLTISLMFRKNNSHSITDFTIN